MEFCNTLVNGQFENVPDYLKTKNQWLGWRREFRGGKKPTKTPLQLDGSYARSNDPATWTSFDAAVKGLALGTFEGIGFAFADGDELVGLDIDNCISEDGSIDAEVQNIIDRFATYTELSPSGRGIRCFGFGKAVRNGRKAIQTGFAVEVYDASSPRYLTVTGDCIRENRLAECQDALDWLYETYWARAEVEPKRARGNDGAVDVDLVKLALSVIPPRDYQIWLDIGFALKSAGLGLSAAMKKRGKLAV